MNEKSLPQINQDVSAEQSLNNKIIISSILQINELKKKFGPVTGKYYVLLLTFFFNLKRGRVKVKILLILLSRVYGPKRI